MNEHAGPFDARSLKGGVMSLFTIVDEDGERRARWYTSKINDNERRGGGHGTILKAGRWRIVTRKRYDDVLRVEWHFRAKPSPEAALLARVRPSSVQFHIGLLDMANVWITFKFPRSIFAPVMVTERVFGVRLGYIGQIAWIYLGFDDESDSTGMLDYYRTKKARGERLHFGGNRVQLTQGILLKIRLRLRDRLLGRTAYEKVELRREPVTIPLDGREYEGVWTLHRETWKRPRWPFNSHERVGSWVEVEHPPAFAGKGENSWDCDDDGIFGSGSDSITPAGAVGDYVKSVLRSRERYGEPSNYDAFQPEAA